MEAANIRHVLRLALAPWLVFLLGLIWGLPLAFIGAVFAVIFSLGKKALSLDYGWSLFSKSAVVMTMAWGIATMVTPYPPVMLVAVCVGTLLAYKMQMKTGDLLLAVFSVISALLIPHLAVTSPGLSSAIAFWLMVNLLVAMAASLVVFALFPEPDSTDKASGPAERATESFDLDRRLFRLALVAVPLIVAAFVFDAVTPFILIFVAIQSTQLVANTGQQGSLSQGMLTANVVGGAIAVLVYEGLVIVPLLAFALVAILTALIWFARRFVAGDRQIISGITAFLILVGGSLMPFSDDADTKMIFRLWQLIVAFGYIWIAYAVVDRLFPERKSELPVPGDS